ncbi:hypothetical protein FQR65_LT18213 [Abscondita terminalis]|nr:hypothetical protein FQR65_LT18213 [Abscondita terminalis]
MVKVKDDSAMAEPKPANAATHHQTSSNVRKPHHNHSHHHPPYPHTHIPYYYHFSYSSENSENGTNGAATPATFYFGPGFEPQSQLRNAFGAGPSQGQNGSEYVVLFHVNPGVTISFQIGDSFEVLRERNDAKKFARNGTNEGAIVCNRDVVFKPEQISREVNTDSVHKTEFLKFDYELNNDKSP